jgi:NAD(P)-dependent dehydrogenase (short-subunit alcohol dehydrogenase family)
MEAKPTVLVTGVSTGIGYGLLEVLTTEGYHVFGSVRKQADADRLKKKFGEAFTPLLFDVTNEAAVKAAAEQVHHHFAELKLQSNLFSGTSNSQLNSPNYSRFPIIHHNFHGWRVKRGA